MSKVNVRLGKIQISNDIIALIAAKAALKVEGIAYLVDYAGFKHRDGDHLAAHSVDLEIIRQNVNCNIRVVMDYHYSVLDVARRVQTSIKEDVELMTGLHVTNVHVEIVNILV